MCYSQLTNRACTLDSCHAILCGHADLFQVGARIGFLGMAAHTRRRNRLNARVQHLDTDTNTLRLIVLQSYGNCPKYIQVHAIIMLDAS